MKYIKTYEIHSDINIGDYVLVNFNKELIKIPYGKIIDIIPQSKSIVIRLEIILDDKIITDMCIFSEDVIRKLKRKEIEDFKILKKMIKYNI